ARLPQTIGQTIGIVGGLVIGEAAVQAGVVSPIMVIVIALTAISNFAIPTYSVAISFRIVRFCFFIAACFFGLCGIVFVYNIIIIAFVTVISFDMPYCCSYVPVFRSALHDIIVRTPFQFIKCRLRSMNTIDNTSLNNKREEA